MPRYKVMVCRPCSTGSHRQEVGSFLAHVVEQIYSPASSLHDMIELVSPEGVRLWYDVPVQAFPTSVARNQLVAFAQNAKVDFLFSVDDDAFPPHEFFETAFHFLRKQPTPSVIAAPYCSADGEVQVFEFTSNQPNLIPLDTWSLTRIPRTDAIQRSGIERVASVGTHLVAYDVRVFDEIKKPYYAYQYNEDHTKVTETEDTYCHRHLFNADVPIYVSWEHWAAHYKTIPIGVPEKLTLDQIPEFWLEKAKAVLKAEQSHPQDNGSSPTEVKQRGSLSLEISEMLDDAHSRR